MKVTVDELIPYFNKIREIATTAKEEAVLLIKVKAIVTAMVEDISWLPDVYRQVNSTQGFSGYCIFEEDNHGIAIFVTSWLPFCGSPPHNHGTWAVIGGLVGGEINTFWKRIDDGTRNKYAKLKKESEVVCGKGEILTIAKNEIHSVYNPTSEISTTIAIYGKHPNYTGRSQFDAKLETELPFICEEEDSSLLKK